MNSYTALDLGLKVLQTRLRPVSALPPDALGGPAPFLTLSRETGAGAATLARHLLARLESEAGDRPAEPWALFDKDLLICSLRQQQLPGRLAEFLPEDRVSEVTATIGELVGLHPSLWELEHRVMAAILQLAHLGRVILVGRAAHLITRSLPGGLHVRLVAPLESRVHRFMAAQGCPAAEAEEFIRKSDRARERYVRTNFGHAAGDPLDYDLVINTDRISPAQAAPLVLHALQDRLDSLASAAGRQRPAGVPAY